MSQPINAQETARTRARYSRIAAANDLMEFIAKPHFFLMVLLLMALMLVANACAAPADTAREELTLAPESALPDFVRDASSQVKEAYRFAIANPEVLSAFPCYCGCGAVGHENNLQCYIKEVRPDGSVEFENHAFG